MGHGVLRGCEVRREDRNLFVTAASVAILCRKSKKKQSRNHCTESECKRTRHRMSPTKTTNLTGVCKVS